jgi:hypothetical protein
VSSNLLGLEKDYVSWSVPGLCHAGWEGPIDTVYFTGPSEPVMNGLAPAADGSWVLTLRDGGLAIVSSRG